MLGFGSVFASRIRLILAYSRIRASLRSKTLARYFLTAIAGPTLNIHQLLGQSSRQQQQGSVYEIPEGAAASRTFAALPYKRLVHCCLSAQPAERRGHPTVPWLNRTAIGQR
jgi:hypothetical protein